MFFPENLATMMGAIYDWIESQALGAAVVWAKQDSPAPPKPYVTINLLVPPVPEGQAEHRKLFAIVVDAVLPLTLYTVTINGVDFSHTSDASPTASEIRNGLILAINAGTEPVTAGAVLDDQTLALELERGATSPTIMVSANLLCKLADMAIAHAVATFSINAYADDNPSTGTFDQDQVIAKSIELSLDKGSVLEGLHVGGWSTATIEGVRKPDVLQAARWEKRSGFDARLRCTTRTIDLTDFIEEADLGTGIVGEGDLAA